MADNVKNTFVNSKVELSWVNKYSAGDKQRRAVCCEPVEPVKLRVIERFELLPDRDTYSSNGRLLHGDMRLVIPELDDESVDFAYVDPPFFSNKDWVTNTDNSGRLRQVSNGRSGRYRKQNNTKKTVAYSDRWDLTEYINFLDDLIQIIKPRLKHTGVIAVHTDYRASAYVRLLLEEHFGPPMANGGFINELIWKYGLGNANSKRHFLRKHDTIAVFAKSGDYYFKPIIGPASKAQLAKYCHVEAETGRKYMMSYGRKYYFKGGKPLESVLDIPALSATSRERCGYPTQKPSALLHTLIKAFCPAGGTVLDPCCGSGTTAVAAADMGCNWITCDSQMLAIHTARKRLCQARNCRFSLETAEQLVNGTTNKNRNNSINSNNDDLLFVPDSAEDPCPRICNGDVFIEPYDWIDAWSVGYMFGEACVPCISSYSGRVGGHKDKKLVEASLPIYCEFGDVSGDYRKYPGSDNHGDCINTGTGRIFSQLSASELVNGRREAYKTQIVVGFWNYLGNKYQIILPN